MTHQATRPDAVPVIHPTRRVWPARSESLARGFITFLGGPLGRHAEVGRARWWTPLRVLILTSLVWLSFGFLSKANCLQGVRGEDGVVGLNWSGNRQYVSACYNDILPLYNGRGLNEGGFPYAFSWVEGDLTRYMEYPVLAGLFQGAVAWLTRLTYPLVESLPLAVAESAWYFCLTALVLSAFWVAGIRLLVDLAGNRVWDLWLVAASPIVIMHAFTNWDIPSVFAVILALWLVTRGRPGWAGAAIGLGTAFKLWPLFLLGAFLVLAVRSRAWAAFARMLTAAVLAWLAVNVSVMLRYPQAWAEFTRLNSERGWEWTTVWAVVSRITGWQGFDAGGGAPEILNAVTLTLFALACAGVFALGTMACRRPRVAELVFLIVAAFLLINKVWSPQYSLWLVVPAVLALPRWRLLLAWMLTEMMVWPVLMLHMHGAENKGLPGEVLDVVVLTRDAFIIAMIVLVVRQMLGYGRDKVAEAHGGLDPLAGSFGQADRFVLGRGVGRAGRRDVPVSPAEEIGVGVDKRPAAPVKEGH
ncbi:glycosyltransferase family 87 protein [Corynebacterium guangdongense]|uniref:Membrane protein n=1 Tax=Corynebacterium guangdongense TaxID=1783348 RepID=A0ABU2A0K0_9CORY|nr:glycosyltransferase 87 family protein [Corynebacterium guangdongense]MDR7330530.1 putative membrane protein [Corynebacterium guangdongense]WJZ19085.1 hypothetical protein CGUA_12790 [Corynebacterium guangdongense]